MSDIQEIAEAFTDLMRKAWDNPNLETPNMEELSKEKENIKCESRMKKWLLQLLCKHEWQSEPSTYYRERSGKGVVITIYYCPKCNKTKTEKGYVR